MADAAHHAPPLPGPDAVDRFLADGYLVVRGAFDAAELVAEVDGALRRGFASHTAAELLESDAAAIRFRYLPMMVDRTPASVALLRRLQPVAAALLGGPVAPLRAKAVEYHGGSAWHRDSDESLASVGFACYLEPLTATTGALQVRPGSHRPRPTAAAAPATPVALATEPGDVIAFDEHLLHASDGGRLRRQWRADFFRHPTGEGELAAARRYVGGTFAPDWDGGYDVDAYPTYPLSWRRRLDPGIDAVLRSSGAYAAAAAEEAAARRRRAPTS